MKIEDRLDYLNAQLRRIHDKLDIHEWIKLHYPWNCAFAGKSRKKHLGRCDCHGVYNVKCACGKELFNVSVWFFDNAAEDFSGAY